MARTKATPPQGIDGDEDEGHPLFPVDDGEAPPAIGWIQVRRAEPGAGWVTAPQKFRGHELTSEEDLHRLYGGGTYELYGRALTQKGFMGPITARRTLTLAGKGKPLIAAPEPEEDDADEGAHDAGSMPPYYPGMGGPSVDVGAIIGSLQQSAQAQQAQQLALFTQFMQQQSAMFQAQLAGAKSEGQTVAQLMIEQSRVQAEMFRAQAQKAEALAERALATKSDQSSGLEATLRMMDLLERRVETRVRELEKKTKGSGDDDMTMPLLGLAGTILQAMQSNANAAPPAAPPPPPLPPPVAAPQPATVQQTPAVWNGPPPVAAPPPTSGANGAGAAALDDAPATNEDAAAIN